MRPVAFKKPRVFLNRDLGRRHGKGIDPDAMNRPFHVLTAVGPHGEPASSNLDLFRLNAQRAIGK